jgi:AAA+ ATPase superfamily predicted ATPase
LPSFPYNPAKWTSDPYDRDELKSELLDAFETFRAFLLVGPRRIGKTSLLKHVEAKARDKDLLVSYVNLQESWERSPSAESFVDYYTTTLDIQEIQTIIVEYPGAIGLFAAKAMREPPVDLLAAAVANAVTNATGSRVLDLPHR